jgi:hypothetical protein
VGVPTEPLAQTQTAYFETGAVSATLSLPGVEILVRYGKNGVISNGIFSFAELSATGFAFANST